MSTADRLAQQAPVVIGGMGGSGTRLIAQLLQAMGFHIGDDLNEAADNLWFTLLFKRIEILAAPPSEFTALAQILAQGMTGQEPFDAQQVDLVQSLVKPGRADHSPPWLQQRVDSLLHGPRRGAPNRPWACKEPNSHVVLDRLQTLLPRMKYIHVMRHGLDMAYSANQSQLRLWGPNFIGPHCTDCPRDALAYWCKSHRRVIELGQAMGSRFWLLNYDAFCQQPRHGVRQLAAFLQHELSESQCEQLAAMARLPGSTNRYQSRGIGDFDPRDIDFVRQLGFSIDLNPAPPRR